ncbi:MAG TPA: SDR family NAD(P)-dependent oxidoreductase [Vicinamibacteria bacterium]|nr:SDR family NAD(P)-dependent oxidoreductase [Vicinamibacteria bacterium]
MELKGASALVTGAGRGIGRAIALALARAGAAVTAVSRTSAELDSLVGEVTSAGGRAAAHVADLQDPEAPARALEAAARHGRLQVLVNNAAVGGFQPVLETTDEQWDRTFATNLTAIFRLTRAALPQLMDGGGHVFMISSLAGQNPGPGMAAYGASKAALDYFSHCLMMEVRQHGVKVTTVAPGSVATSFGGGRGDAGWMLTAEDVAQAVLDLLRTRDGAHLSRVEMRPLRPQKR